RDGQCEIKNGAADVVHHEAVQMPQHRRERCATFNLRHGLGINSVGYQRGADAVPGNVANHNAEIIFSRSHQAEISADSTYRLIKRFDTAIAPDDALGREALLTAG